MSSILHGKNALVLGGSGGIGAAVSRLLVAAGCRVLVHGGHSREKLDRLVAELQTDVPQAGTVRAGGVRAGGVRAEGRLLPIQRPADIDPLFEGKEPFDIVICAFCPFVRGALVDLDAAAWERAALLDCALPGYLVSRSLPSMLERGFGRYLFFGGTNTDVTRAFKGTVAYGAAKASLGVLVKSVASAGAARGVAANVLCPGLVVTEYTDEGEIAAMERLSGGIPLVSVEDMASLACSTLESPVLNGAVIAADRGVSVGYCHSV